MKIEELQQKKIIYRNKKLYAINNTDTEVLDEHSDFSLGSITKIFTALTAVILDEQGVLSLDENVDKYLTSKQLKGIKIIDLITHTSGLKGNYEGYDPEIGMEKEYKTLLDLFQDYKKEKMATGEKGKYVYSNLGYNILGAVIESATGMNFEDVVREKIFDPLGMKNSGFGKTKTTLYDFNKKKLTKFIWNEINSSKADGGLRTTIFDLLKFKNFTSLINKTSLEKMKKFYFLKFDSDEDCWRLSHNGAQSGVWTRLTFKYNKDWSVKSQLIMLSTNAEILFF